MPRAPLASASAPASASSGYRGLVVPPNHLVAAADPEQCFSLTAHVAYRLVQLGGPREERQLAGIFAGSFRVAVALLEEAAMDEPATSQSQVSLDRIEFPLGYRQCAAVAIEEGPVVEPPRPVDPFVCTHEPRLSPS